MAATGTKATVKVMVLDRGLETTLTTDRAVRVAPGLAVTPAVRNGEDGLVFATRGAWVVTHLPSGTKVIAYPVKSKARAIALAQALARLTDWTMHATALRKQRGLYQKVRRVRNLHGDLMEEV